MDPKEKRNKEVHTATVFIPAGTKVRHLQTGELVYIPEDTQAFGWYLLEKMQWFYWTVFLNDGIRGEYLAMVRRDMVSMKSGTHRVVHREVVQKRMQKILKKNSLDNAVLPLPPKPQKPIKTKVEYLEPEWKDMYLKLFAMSTSMYGSRVSWTEERREKFIASMRKTLEQKLSEKEAAKKPMTPEELQELQEAMDEDE